MEQIFIGVFVTTAMFLVFIFLAYRVEIQYDFERWKSKHGRGFVQGLIIAVILGIGLGYITDGTGKTSGGVHCRGGFGWSNCP